MTVSELIVALADMPRDADVWCLWDGATRSEVDIVWISREGKVVFADCTETSYYDVDRPVDAPTVAQDRYWPMDPSL